MCFNLEFRDRFHDLVAEVSKTKHILFLQLIARESEKGVVERLKKIGMFCRWEMVEVVI